MRIRWYENNAARKNKNLKQDPPIKKLDSALSSILINE